MNLLLHNGMEFGDTLMMTCGVRDLKKQHDKYILSVDTRFSAIWDNNPYIVPWKKPDDDYAELYLGPRIVVQGSSHNGLKFGNAFRMCLEHKLNIQIRQGNFAPDLHLTDAEKARRIINGPYWLVCTDAGPMEAKRWHPSRWQELIDRTPWIQWAQIGLKQYNRHRLQGSNIIDFIGKTDNLRELFSLMYNCDGFVGLVSGPMHLAAAFDKPAVIIAGAREPISLERYDGQRYLETFGCLPCATGTACWACGLSDKELDKCKRKEGTRVNGIPKCIDMITVDHVIDAIESYYIGGRLTKPETTIQPTTIPKQQTLRIVSNGKILGGAEKSVVEIAKMAVADGWNVELVTRGGILCEAMKVALPGVVSHTNNLTTPCDVLLLYASDMIWDFHKPEFEPFKLLQAERKVMALTYKSGKTKEIDWAQNWDDYIFLSSSLRNGFGKGQVLPPPVDLEPFFAIEPQYDKTVTVLRHSSQGDSKYPRGIENVPTQCPSIAFQFMPGPSWIGKSENVTMFKENQLPVAEFLSRGNVFWYMLPENYTDQGPRVVMEAMAAGLPVICERRDGCADRVTEETGWFVDGLDGAVEVINQLSRDEIRTKGTAAREHARTAFKKEVWWKAIQG